MPAAGICAPGEWWRPGVGSARHHGGRVRESVCVCVCVGVQSPSPGFAGSRWDASAHGGASRASGRHQNLGLPLGCCDRPTVPTRAGPSSEPGPPQAPQPGSPRHGLMAWQHGGCRLRHCWLQPGVTGVLLSIPPRCLADAAGAAGAPLLGRGGRHKGTTAAGAGETLSPAGVGGPCSPPWARREQSPWCSCLSRQPV